jgi:sugar/nucleoside kinase (ribokinase family)
VRIVVLGDVMADVVAAASGRLARGSDTPARVRFTGGGSGANVAAWLAFAGAAVALVTRVGDDERGRAAIAALHGVDVRAELDPDRPTGCCVVVVEPGGERTMLPDPGANDAPARVPDNLLIAGDHLHVSGYALLRDGSRPGALAALERARAAGMTTSLDLSSWALLRAGALDGVSVDLLRANADEAAALSSLAALAPEVVVTLGPGGAMWTDGRAVERVEAPPADVVDTTGAGDAFTAGFLAARARGPRPALEAGCALAARVVSVRGARPPTAA